MRRFCLSMFLAITGVFGLTSSAFAQISAEEELKTLRPADGIEMSLFASEPMITNPSCIDVDTQGRVWVAEIQFYRGAVKNPPNDKIKVLEDTDHDGKADKVTVFADGLFAPMSVCVCGDKVYAFVHGDFLVWEDKNGDLVADGPPKKILTGFSNQNHDHTAHSIVVGPDHKWYMAHGDTGYKVTGTDGSKIEFRFGGMIRGELDGSKLENVAVNFRNPYEICVSSFGDSFCSDNDNDGNESVRICWILEGGNYGWNGGPPFNKPDLDRNVPKGTPFRETWHFRGYIPGNVPGTLVTGFGSPTGICFYEGDAFGTKYKNAPLHTDPGPRVVRIYRHTPSGVGMKATSEVWLTNEGDGYFRPDDVCTAPDGSLYVSDWYDGGVGGHAYNNPNQGRIFVARPAGQKLERKEKPGPYANVADAIEGLKSPNMATQFLAREKLLAEGQGAVAALQPLLKDSELNNQARALWVLDRIGGPARDAVVERLKSDDPAMRALAVRILRRHGDEYAAQILPLASDKNGEVIREVILACGKISGESALKALASIAATYDGSDRYLLEAINIAAGQNKKQLYEVLEKEGKVAFTMLPLLQLLNPEAATAMVTAKLNDSGLDQNAIKALVDTAGNISSIEAGRGLLKLVANPQAPADLRKAALAKLTSNMSGPWGELAKEPATMEIFAKLLGTNEFRSTLLKAIGSLGLKQFGPQVLSGVATVDGVDPADRVQAVNVAVQIQADGAGAALEKLLSDKDATVRAAALNGIVDLQDIKTLRKVLTSNDNVADLRQATVKRLMETTGGALVLLRMVDSGELKDPLKQETIAMAVAHPDSNIRVLYEKFIPEDKRPKKLGSTIKPEEILALTGDPARGEQIFRLSSAAQCKSCHVVQGAGGNVGPDLSMIGRKYERAALLETIMNPSKAIAPEFRPYLLETTAGQVFAGFLVEKSDQQVVLKDVKANLIRVPASEVEALIEQEKSLMPELVLQEVTAQDAADLLAFLTKLTQGVQIVGSYRVLGPLPIRKGDLDGELEPEKTIGSPDLGAKYKGPDGKPMKWEVANAADGKFDSVAYDNARQMPNGNVAHYFYLVANSSAAQTAVLQIGSDDGVKVWANGQVVHKNNVTRAMIPGQDKVSVQLQPGRNVLVFKVINGDGGGGFSLGIRSPEPIDVRTE